MSEVLQNIWTALSSDGVTQSSYDEWQKNFMSNRQVQANVYRYLKENDYTQNDINTWASNISESIAVKQAEVKTEQEPVKRDEQTALEKFIGVSLPEWDISKTMQALQLQKEVAKSTYNVSDYVGSGASQIGLSVLNGLYNNISGFSSSEQVEETDKYKDNFLLDLFSDITLNFKRDYVDTEDTDAIESINDSIKSKKKFKDEDIEAMIENSLKVAKMGQTDEARAYQKTYDTNKAKYGSGVAFFQGLAENPSFIIQTLSGSLGRMAGTVINSEEGYKRALRGGATGAGLALAAGQAGPQAFIPEELASVPIMGLAGIFSTVSGTMERASTFQQLIEEQLAADGKKFTVENVKEFLNNDTKTEYKDPNLPLTWQGTNAEIIRKRSLSRGIAIGAVDGFTTILGFGVGGRMKRAGMAGVGAKGAPVFTKGQIGLAQSVVGVGGGLISETAGQIAGGQELEAGEILLEGVAEKALAITGVTTVPTLLSKRATYSIDGGQTFITEKQFLTELSNMTDEEVAMMQDKIKVKGDKFTNNRWQTRSNVGTYMSQVSPTVTNQEDRRRLAKKQMELDRLKVKNKNKNESSKDTSLEERITKIQEQISDIIATYDTQPEIAPEMELDAQRTREKVRQARFNFLKNEILEGTKQSKSFKNMDISAEEMSADEAVNQFIEQEGANLLYDLSLLNANLEAETDAKVKRQIRKKIREVEQEYNTLEQAAEEARTSHGFLLEDNSTGKMKIVINSDMALADGGNINVAAHELLHGVLRNVFLTETGFRARELKGTGLQTGQKLLDFLVDPANEQLDLLFGGEIIQRLKEYQGGDIQGQEVLNLLSDAMINTNYNSSFEAGLVGLGQRLSEILQAYLPERYANKLNFADGKQVFDFIKTFNRAVQGDKVAGRIVERVRRGGFTIDESKVSKKEKGKGAKAPMSKAASDRVQKIYEQDGVDGAFQIIEEFKPITTRIARRYRNVPGYDEQLLIDEIETGRRGIYDMIANEYNPQSGVPLAAYINKFLPARAIEAANRILDTEFTEDVTEAKGVAAEETTSVEAETKPRQKKTVLSKRLGITDKVVKAIRKILPDLDVSNLTFKALKNQVPGIVGELFGISPKKIQSGANLTKKELQSAQMFINKNADLLIAMLPEGATTGGTATGVPKVLLNEFYTKKGRAKAAQTGSRAGLAVQQKNNIDKTDFLEVFGIIEGKPVRTDRNTSARVLALANTLGKMITNQEVRQQLAEQGTPDTDITRIGEGKARGMFSKKAPSKKAQQTSLYVSDIIKKNWWNNKLESLGLSTIPRVKKKPQMQELVPNMENTTWEAHLTNRITAFLDEYPQYYEAMRITFTGGNRFAFGKGPKFAETFLTDKIKNTEQIVPIRNRYNRSLTDIEKKEDLKGKRQKKDIAERDDSVDQGKVEQLIDLYRVFGKWLNENENDVWWVNEFMLHGSLDQNNFGRWSFPFIGFAIDENGDAILNAPVVEEHSPQAEIMRILGAAAIDNRIDEVVPLVKALVSQMSILLKDDPSGKLKASNGVDFHTNVSAQILSGNLNWLKPGYASIYRLMKHGVDPNMYFLKAENKTIAEYFNVDNLPVEQARQKIIESFETGVEPVRGVFSKGKLQNKGLWKATSFSRSTKNPAKGITILDFDDTLATTKSLVKYTTPDGQIGTLNAEEYAATYEDLLDEGYEFDFSDFEKVVEGEVAPLFNKAKKLAGKFGTKNIFILTARPPGAARPIQKFLKQNGLDIPLKNITGLANSTSEAKALWIANKVGEGYNDFYFADDALQNVQAVKNILDQFDVKSKIQQARVNFSKPANLDNAFNNILEDVTGIESEKRFSAIKARKRGASKGKFRLFIPPSHEDFVGLLYNFMGKGEQGNRHRDFFEESLIKPLNRGYREIDAAKQAIANDYKSLNQKFSDIKSRLLKKTPDGDFTYEDAIRVYLWDKHGHTIPGMSPTDQAKLSKLVEQDPRLKTYADSVNEISKIDEYVAPEEGWDAGGIRTDLVDATGRVGRAKFFTEFQENADVIFSEENLNKIEAGYGKGVRSAIEDMLHRIKTGINRPKGQSKTMNVFMNWLNGAVGSVMFFNMRSMGLQQLSIVNYINFADNNPLAAAKAFADQAQYWTDFAFLFNSDMLKQRRGGIGTDINGAELAASVKNSKNPAAVIISKLLAFGFTPTQIGDSFAISVGGATFYRNRINTYLKQGFSQEEAKAKAFEDFQETTESTQQSARPDKTSQQQSNWIGKIVLNFQNVTSQYNRIIKKSGSDIINRRISKGYTNQIQSDMANLSRIAYYGAIQNVIFYSLQTALFAVMFGDEDESQEKFLGKKERVINGTMDSLLRGTGIYGALASTLKNIWIANYAEREKGYNPDESAVLVAAADFSPVVGIKARKVVQAEKTLNYNKKLIPEMEVWDIDNPMWDAYTNRIEAATNLPVNRLYRKTINLRDSLDNQFTAFHRALMFFGYSKWNLGLTNKEIEALKLQIKNRNKGRKRKTRSTRSTRKTR